MNNLKPQIKHRRLMLAAMIGGIGAAVTYSNKFFGLRLPFTKGYSKQFEFTYGNAEHPVDIHSVVKANDGGYVITVNGSFSNVIKVNKDGILQWEQILKGNDKGSSMDGNDIVAYGNDGFLLVGETDSHDLLGHAWDEKESKRNTVRYEFSPYAALLSKIQTDGTIAWQKTYAGLQARANNNSAHYVLPVKDGFIIFGVKTLLLPESPLLGKWNHATVPWIFKVNMNGEIQWEREFQKIDDKLVKVGISTVFSKPCIDAEENIFFAFLFSDIGLDADETGRMILDPFGQGMNERILMMKIDGAGKEIARYQLPKGFESTSIPVLLPSEAGFDVFVTAQYDETKRTYIGFYHYRLDDQLKQIAQQYVAEEKFRPIAALADGDKGFHLFGNSVAPGHDDGEGRAELVYMRTDGTLQHEMTFSRGAQPIGIVDGHGLNEVVIYYNLGDGRTSKLEKYVLTI